MNNKDIQGATNIRSFATSIFVIMWIKSVISRGIIVNVFFEPKPHIVHFGGTFSRASTPPCDQLFYALV
jgi:hypothetical protein